MVKPQPSKLMMRVRFPLPALFNEKNRIKISVENYLPQLGLLSNLASLDANATVTAFPVLER